MLRTLARITTLGLLALAPSTVLADDPSSLNPPPVRRYSPERTEHLRSKLRKLEPLGHRDPRVGASIEMQEPNRDQTRDEKRAVTTPEDQWGNITVHDHK